MTLVNAFFIFFLLWWVILFMTLPFGVRRADEADRGHDAGAPQVHGMGKKMIVTTVISLMLVAVLWVLVDMEIIRWYDFFDTASRAQYGDVW